MNKFIHHSVVVYLALIVLLRMMAMPISLLDYSFNQRFITANLCENRLKPDMHCGGTCYLKKQLAKTSDSQESGSQKSNSKTVVVDFFEPMDKPTVHLLNSIIAPASPAEASAICNEFTGNIFHPPIA